MRTLLALAALALATTACQGSASARLKLKNDTQAAPLHRLEAAAPGPWTPGDAVFVAPTVLKLKLVAVYLAEDVDPQTQDNVGQTAMIYLNPECHDEIDKCGPSAAFARQITSYFDFAQGTEAVNAALNAQENPIKPGTYRYARMEFCKYGPGTEPNLIWQAPAMSAPATGIFNTCGITSQPFATPLELAAGDTATVELSYDLSQAAMAGTATGDSMAMVDAAGTPRFFMYCATEGTTRSCLQYPDFTPGVVR